jgi:hypothetical protein
MYSFGSPIRHGILGLYSYFKTQEYASCRIIISKISSETLWKIIVYYDNGS